MLSMLFGRVHSERLWLNFCAFENMYFPLKSSSAHALMSWLKDSALLNMYPTDPVLTSHDAKGWLNALAPENALPNEVHCDTSQLSNGWLNSAAPPKASFRLVTGTRHELMFPLNFLAFRKNR